MVIVLFDGECNLCSGSVQFIIKRDPKLKFKFASLQSIFGQQQLEKMGLSKNELHSVILLKSNSFFQRSDAALEIARELSAPWPALYVFKIVPSFIRDFLYDWIARNRYTWFGKKESCWLPSPELRSRFID